MTSETSQLTPVNTERPEIIFEKNTQHGLDHDHIFLKVRGRTLDECRKHFDEIRKEVV